VDLQVHESWDDFKKVLPSLGTPYFFTKFADREMTDVDFASDLFGDSARGGAAPAAGEDRGRIALVFGSEIDGFTSIADDVAAHFQANTVRYPMDESGGVRSYNLANTASMALWEAYKAIAAEKKRGAQGALGAGAQTMAL